MKNTDRIVHTLRTNPGADITALVEEDASTVTAKVVSTTHIPIIRAIIIEFVRSVHLASAQALRREKQRRTAAELDAAQTRALLHAANRRLRRAKVIIRTLHAEDVLDPAERKKLLTELDTVLTPVQSAVSH